jgi:hypothetical protein
MKRMMESRKRTETAEASWLLPPVDTCTRVLRGVFY